MTKQNFIITLLITISVSTFGTGNKPSSRISVKDYIKKWAPTAQKHMKEYRIPASIILAQGILESGYGNSSMAQNANNHFGIKCLGWKGAGYYQRNSERQCYRKYEKTEDCFRDHARILTSKSRYSFLFRLHPTDYRSWAIGLKKAGYAMDPYYDQLLINTIEEYKLYAIDRMVAGNDRLSTKEERLEAERLRLVKAKETKTWQDMLPINSLGLEAPKPAILSIEIPEPIFESALIDTQEEPALQEVASEPVSEEWMPEVNLRHLIIQDEVKLSELAADLDISLEKLLLWNDLKEDALLKVGNRVFLEEKNKTCGYSVCTARANQSLWEVSQIYGLHLKHLEHLNHLKPGQQPIPGTIIRLK